MVSEILVFLIHPILISYHMHRTAFLCSFLWTIIFIYISFGSSAKSLLIFVLNYLQGKNLPRNWWKIIFPFNTSQYITDYFSRCTEISFVFLFLNSCLDFSYKHAYPIRSSVTSRVVFVVNSCLNLLEWSCHFRTYEFGLEAVQNIRRNLCYVEPAVGARRIQWDSEL